MKISMALYLITALFCTSFSFEEPSLTIDPEIYTKTVDVQKTCDKILFDETLKAYNQFYNHSCKHVKLRMGEVSKIQQKIVTGNEIGSLEIVYNETIKLENKSIALTSEIVELRFYKRRKSSYDRVLPSEIAKNSRRASLVEKHKKNIREKSEKLISFLTKKY
ncbi:MAG: hypothetical protein COA58_02070 [Bacteroidetes bacterium]|nr:MAG: hypothetical protein COA58_02070 [Bacteroidota bacterium]